MKKIQAADTVSPKPETLSGRGGARKGAGRPKQAQTRKTVSFRLPEDCIKHARNRGTLGTYIEGLIRADMNR